jgi:hypothetical protein
MSSGGGGTARGIPSRPDRRAVSRAWNRWPLATAYTGTDLRHAGPSGTEPYCMDAARVRFLITEHQAVGRAAARADSPRNSAAPSVPQARVRHPARPGDNHHDVTSSWSAPPRCHIVVVTGALRNAPGRHSSTTGPAGPASGMLTGHEPHPRRLPSLQEKCTHAAAMLLQRQGGCGKGPALLPLVCGGWGVGSGWYPV